MTVKVWLEGNRVEGFTLPLQAQYSSDPKFSAYQQIKTRLRQIGLGGFELIAWTDRPTEWRPIFKQH